MLRIDIIDRKKYIEVNDSFTISAKSTLPIVSYTIDYGDNTPYQQTKESTFSHSYHIFGNYTVTVWGWIVCPNINKTMRIEVFVEKPVGIVNLGEVQVKPALLGNISTFKVRRHGGLMFTCLWQFGDGYEIKTYHTGIHTIFQFSYLYRRHGSFAGNVNCSNRISTQRVSFNAQVQVEIAGLQIEPIAPQPIKSDIIVSWSVTNGTNIKAVMCYEFEEKIIHLQPGSMKGLFAISSSRSGKHAVKIKIWNLVSKNISKSTEFYLYPKVKGFKINLWPNNFNFFVNHSIEITISKENLACANFITYSINLDDGVELDQVHFTRAFSYVYFKSAKYSLNVTGYNPVSSFSAAKIVNIVPSYLKLSGLSCYSNISTTSQLTEIKCLMNKGSQFRCIFTWREFTISTVSLEHLQLTDRWRNMSDFQNISISASYHFRIPRVYDIHINCHNKINEVSTSVPLYIEEPIENIGIVISANKIKVEVNETFLLYVSSLRSMNLTYIFDFGDGMVPIETNMSSVQYSYSKSGVFHIWVRLLNEVSIKSSAMRISVQKPILKMGFISSNSVIGYVGQVINHTLYISEGSDFVCIIDFGNGDMYQTDKLHSYSYEVDSKEAFSDRFVHFQHVYKLPCKFSIHYVCSNRLGNSSSVAIINIYKRVTPFTVHFTVSTKDTEINDTIQIIFSNFNLANDAEITYQIDMGDLSGIYITDQQTWHYRYSRHGVFRISINASNPASYFILTSFIIVEKPVLQLSNVELEIAPTEMRSSSTITLKIGKGSDFLCTLYFRNTSLQVDMRSELMFFRDYVLDSKPFTNIVINKMITIMEPGAHRISGKCENRVSISHFQRHAIVYELKNITVFPIAPKLCNNSFNITWTTHLKVTKTILKWKTSQNNEIDIQGNAKYITVSGSNLPKSNKYCFNLMVATAYGTHYNMDGNIIAEVGLKFIIVYLNPPTNRTYAVGFPIRIKVQANTKQTTQVAIDFGDGKIIKGIVTDAFSHEYENPGIYYITVVAHNNVSIVQNQTKVEIIKKTRRLTRLSLDYKTTTISNIVTIKVHVETQSRCNIDFGDGFNLTFSSGGSSMLTSGIKHVGPENTSHVFVHFYTISNLYIITATCINKISKISNNTAIQILPRSQSFKLIGPVKVEVNSTFTIKISPRENYLMMYEINFNDGNTPLKMLNLSAEFRYTKKGIYTIKATELYSSRRFSKTIRVVVVDTVQAPSGLALSIQDTFLGSPAILYLTLKEGTEFECNIDWGDNESSIINSNQSVQGPVLAAVKYDPTFLMSTNHTYKSYGLKKIICNCINNNGGESKVHQIVVSKQLANWGEYLNKSKIHGKTFNLTIRLAPNISDSFVVIWRKILIPVRIEGGFGNAEISKYMYVNPGLYIFEIFIISGTNNHLLWQQNCSVLIQEEIGNFDIIWEPFNASFELNERAQVNVITKSGSNLKYSFSCNNISNFTIQTLAKLECKFRESGRAFVEVGASNNVSRRSTKKYIKVKIPVSLLKNVFIESSAVPPDQLVFINANIVGGWKFQCRICFGDNSSKTSVINQNELNSTQNDNIRFQHVYRHPGRYLVTLVCFNRLSKIGHRYEMVIQDRLYNLAVEKVLPKATNEVFNIAWFSNEGTDLSYYVSFLRKIYTNISRSNGLYYVRIKAEGTGIYQAEIVAFNRVSMSKATINVSIEVPISGLKIQEPKVRNFETNKQYKICLTLEAGTNSKYRVTFNNLSSIEHWFQEPCFFYSFGSKLSLGQTGPSISYNVNVSAWNNISHTSISDVFTVFKPVLKILSTTLRCSPADTRSYLEVILTIRKGSDFSCTWSFTNNSLFDKTYHEYIYTKNNSLPTHFENISIKESMLYTEPGLYLVQVKCSNRLSLSKSVTICLVQEGISNLICKSNIVSIVGKNNTIRCSVDGGTNISYFVLLDDTNITKHTSNHNKMLLIHIDNTLNLTAGVYKVLVVATNIVSNETFSINMQYEEKIDESMVDLLITGPIINGQFLASGNSLNLSVIVKEPLTMKVRWIVDVKRSTKRYVFDTSVLKFQYAIDGLYNLTYTVHNTISSIRKSLTLIVAMPILLGNLTSDTPRGVNLPITYSLKFDSIGNMSCYELNDGNGKNHYFMSPDANCSQYFPDIDSKLFQEISWSTNLFNYPIVYDSIGKFRMILRGINSVSQETGFSDVEINVVDCKNPVATFSNLEIKQSKATRLARSAKMTIYTKIEVPCAYTSKTIFRWKIFRINATTGLMKHQTFNMRIYNFNPFVEKDLIIKRKSLPYGTYMIEFVVRMDDKKADKFQTTIKGYLTIYPSKLQPLIKGGSLIRRGSGAVLAFDASVSTDPDIERGNTIGK